MTWTPTRLAASLGRQLAHDAVEPRLALEADARRLRRRDEAVGERGVVGKTAEVAKRPFK
jgi:hypothetical protein